MIILRNKEYVSPAIEEFYLGPEAQILDYSTLTIEDGELEDWGSI